MQKIAFFYATFPRPTETFVRRELRAVRELGFEPKVYSIWGGQKKWEGFSIECFSLWRLWTLFFWLPYWAWQRPSAFRDVLLALWRKPCPNLQNWNETFLGLGYGLVEAHRMASKQYDVLHGVWATMPATAAYSVSKLIGVPFSMGAHAYDLFRKGGDWLLDEKFEQASMVRTSSNSSGQRLFAHGLNDRKVKVIRRGLSHWPVRASFELSKPNRINLISVGRLVEKKGYFYLLRILSRLSERNNIDFQMKIVGMGPLFRSLEQEIERYGLDKKVTLVGSKTEEEIRELFLQADAKLFTGIIASNGDRDGIPNVIPEAMSAGCLILASSFAGASEAFTDGVSGFSFHPQHFEEWTCLLEDFGRNPSKYQSIRKKAQISCRQMFDVSNTARSLIRNFQDIIHRNEKSRS